MTARREPSRVVYARQKRMRDRRRAALVARLGGRCAQGGGREELEFDHVYGRGPGKPANKVASHMRIKHYEQDAAAGLLRLLCRACNRREGAAWRVAYAAAREEGEQAAYVDGYARYLEDRGEDRAARRGDA